MNPKRTLLSPLLVFVSGLVLEATDPALRVRPGGVSEADPTHEPGDPDMTAKPRITTFLWFGERAEEALRFYRKRNFQKMDAAIFLSRKLETAADLLGPRRLKRRES